jgi:hypothetical protein
MDIESITLYLAKKDLVAVTIHAEINNGLGEGTVDYSTVTRSCETRKSDPMDNAIL